MDLLFAYLVGLLAEPIQGADDYWVTWYMWMYYPTFTRLDGLLTGVTLAAIVPVPSCYKNKRVMALGNYLLLIGLALLTGAWFLCEDPTTFYASSLASR